jgi:phospholipid transport system transporter-binding protein
MTTRKHQKPVRKRAPRQPPKRGAARRRPAGDRGGAAAAAAAAAPQTGAPEEGVLTLAADCTVAAADALKSELVRRLEEPEPVTLDVGALQRIDTAGLQLLAAFVRDRRTAGRAIEWRGRAPALEAAAGLLGLNDMLELAGEVGR